MGLNARAGVGMPSMKITAPFAVVRHPMREQHDHRQPQHRVTHIHCARTVGSPPNHSVGWDLDEFANKAQTGFIIGMPQAGGKTLEFRGQARMALR